MDEKRRQFLKILLGGATFTSGALLISKTISGTSLPSAKQQAPEKIESLDDFKYPNK